jgi:tyramine---L-glutamate ligase
LKLLVLEYITGGGFAGETLPTALMAEGRMMLQALLDELKLLPQLQLRLVLDDRCSDISVPANTQVHWMAQTDDLQQVLPELINQSDWVWPIAPETDGILTKIALQVVKQQKILLLSDPETVALCSNKLWTYQSLVEKAIPVVETYLLADLIKQPFDACVIKPIDGVGCEGNQIIRNRDQFQRTIDSLDNPGRYVIQPLLAGQAISLSCLFKGGRGWLLCCNQQQIDIINDQFNLQGCLVNTSNKRKAFYQTVVDQIADAIPDLWGYIGIDIIETVEEGPLILEINPRLTASYVGIKLATGINVAEQVINLLYGEPCLVHANQVSVNVVIH